MGPRRRLEIAVKQVKEEKQQELSSGSVPHEDTTPTPFKENEKELKVRVMRLQSQLTQVISLLCCVCVCVHVTFIWLHVHPSLHLRVGGGACDKICMYMQIVLDK